MQKLTIFLPLSLMLLYIEFLYPRLYKCVIKLRKDGKVKEFMKRRGEEESRGSEGRGGEDSKINIKEGRREH